MPDALTPDGGDTSSTNDTSLPLEDTFSPVPGHGAAGRLLSTDVDKFTKATKLFADTVTKQSKQYGTITNTGAWNGGAGASASAANVPGLGASTAWNAAYKALGGEPPAPTPSYTATPGTTLSYPPGQSAMPGSQQVGGSGGAPASAPAPMTQNAGNTPGPTGAPGSGAPSGGTSALSAGVIGGTIGGILGGASSVFNALGGSAQTQLSNQLAANAYTSQGALWGNRANTTAQLRQAFGMSGANVNFMAQSPQDAAQEWANLQAVSGAQLPMQTSIGRAAFGQTAGFAIANPGMSATAASQAAGAMYSPQQSLLMRSLGYMTPRVMGQNLATGGGSGPALIAQNQLQNQTGGYLSPKQFASFYAAGGIGQQLQLAEGLNPQQYDPTLALYNRLGYGAGGQKPLTPDQQQQLINRASQGNAKQRTSAVAELKRYGAPQATLQYIQATKAEKTSIMAAQSEAYNAGLQLSSATMGSLYGTIAKVLQWSQLDKVYGALSGAKMGIGAGAAGGISGIIEKIGGLYMGIQAIGKAVGIAKAIPSALSGAGDAVTSVGAMMGIDVAGATTGAAGAVATLATVAMPVAAGVIGGIIVTELMEKLFGQKASTRKLAKGLQHQGFAGTQEGPGQPALNAWLAEKGAKNPVVTGATAGLASIFDPIAGLFENTPNTNRRSQGGGGAIRTGSPGPLPPSSKQAPKNPGTSRNPSNASTAAKNAVAWAQRWATKTPYFEGNPQIPGKGLDCAGLTQLAYLQAGINLPRTSQEQWHALERQRIKLSDVQEGDLVFGAGVPAGTAANPGHVGLMISKSMLIQESGPTGMLGNIVPYNPQQWLEAARPTGGVGVATKTAHSGGGPPLSNAPRGKGLATAEDVAGGGISEAATYGSGLTGGVGGQGGGAAGPELILPTQARKTQEANAKTAPVGAQTEGQSAYVSPLTAYQGYHPASQRIVNTASPPGSHAPSSSKPHTSSLLTAKPSPLHIAQYLMSRGYSKAAAAGMAGVSGAEDPGSSPEQVQYGTTIASGGGYGLIQWTPPFTGHPKNAVPPDPTGNAKKDYAAQLKAMFNWAGDPINKFGPDVANKYKTPYTAALAASAAYERPAVASSDVNAAIVSQVYAQLGGHAAGGLVTSGKSTVVGERGPEIITTDSDAHVTRSRDSVKLLKTVATKTPDGPWAAGQGDQYKYSPMHPVYSGGRTTSAININNGDIIMHIKGAGNDTAANAKAMAQGFVGELKKLDLYQHIQSGTK